jgi:hypothetical protein
MQCGNCHFENMPGSDACGRCGGSLRLAAAAVDVHPPRAGRWAKRWRWRPWIARHWYAFRHALPHFAGGPHWDVFPEAPQLAVLLRMIVPGWPQRYLGRLLRGRIFFWGYLAALLLGLLFIGTSFGSLLLGLALSLHACSVLDMVLNEPGATLRSLAIRAAACLLVLVCVVYLPAGHLLGWVATPQRLLLDSPPFAAGDVVLYSPLAYRIDTPRPGDVVICDVPMTQIAIPNLGRAGVIQAGGLRIERLLAGPGATVEWASGRLLVNGRPAESLPLSLQSMPEKFVLQVPEGRYLIVPAPLELGDTVFVHGAPIRAAQDGFVYRQPVLVARGAILGRVYLHTQPLWRLGWIR